MFILKGVQFKPLVLQVFLKELTLRKDYAKCSAFRRHGKQSATVSWPTPESKNASGGAGDIEYKTCNYPLLMLRG